MNAEFTRFFRQFAPLILGLMAGLASPAVGQSLINVDFGAGTNSPKSGFAATGQSTNDFWNRYRHYEPKFSPGMPMVANGRLEDLRFADGSPSRAAITVSNAPGVWGNATGDPMLDSYIFAPNGSNIVVTLTGLEPGRYHFYLYGYAAADASPEQNPFFTLQCDTNHFGPETAAGAASWAAGQPWREHGQFAVFRDVPVAATQAVTIEIAPGAGGIAVLNGLQILSRGTGPPRLAVPAKALSGTEATNLIIREIHYTGALTTTGALFSATIEAESRTTNELAAPLFEGDLALLSPRLPDGWRIASQGRQLLLCAAAPGSFKIELQIAAKIQRAEPWNQLSFLGPFAAIATVEARAVEPGVEVQLASGSAIEGEKSGLSTVRGVIGADRQLALRWQGKTAEITRDAVVKVETKITARLSPAALRHTSQFRYQVLQSSLTQVKIELPGDQTLTQLQGDSVRDWKIEPADGRQILAVDFIRPVTNAATLTLTTEQTIASLPATLEIQLARPLGVDREAGELSVTADGALARIENATGLRQVEAGPNELAAYQFNARPAGLRTRVSRVEPLITATDRIRARLEENRWVIRHELEVNAERAGLYTLELTPQPGFVVAEVQSDGLDDWKFADGKIRASFAHPILGNRKIVAQLEQALTNTPPQLVVLPLKVAGAEKETALIGAGSASGLELKTAALDGARETPVNALPDRKDDLLAFRADKADWQITLSAEKLTPRVVAQVFNLVTIGDGLVGGSATIRYGIVNQGVRQFRLRLPKHWRNVEFTGPGVRRKDQQDDIWTVSLQDKAWGGYTLVLTYDYPFDPKKATLDAAGARPLDVERETGAVAVTSVGNLAIEAGPIAEPLRQIDPTELADADRGLISRPVLKAYRYEGTNFALAFNLARHDEVAGLDAVADRAQLTTVLTENGEMLTEAGFMVKNNERQFQGFKLPPGASLWGVTVNNQPVKAERDGDWALVSLPQGANRDEAFAVDLQYAQQIGSVGGIIPKTVDLVAPVTDVPGTYSEWKLYVPSAEHASGFTGNMTVTPGTTYALRDGWNEFAQTYTKLWHYYGIEFVFGVGTLAFVSMLISHGRRHGFRGVATVIGLFFILAILGSMLVPNFVKARNSSMRNVSINNLVKIGGAAQQFALEHEGRMPGGFEDLKEYVGGDSTYVDPESGERYAWVGTGKSASNPNAILAYSGEKQGQRNVVFADGSIQTLDAQQYAEAYAKDAVLASKNMLAPATPPPPAAVVATGRENDGTAAFDSASMAKRYSLKREQVRAAASEPAQDKRAAQMVTPYGINGESGVRQQIAASDAAGSPLITRSTTMNVQGQGGGGGGGQFANGPAAIGGLPAQQPAPGQTAAVPTATGIKSLRIAIPKSGRAFSFTRVLNLGGEPPNIRLSLMRSNAFVFMRTLLQVAGFVVGLGIFLAQWRRAEPKTLWMAIGAALALVATANLFVTWRLLGAALIAAVPALALLGIFWAGWKLAAQARARKSYDVPPAPASVPPPSIPPAAAGLLLLALLAPRHAGAAEAKPVSPVSIVSATYTGEAREQTARLDATLDFIAAATNQTVVLFGRDTAVEEFAATTGAARLWRDGEKIGVTLPEKGPSSVRLKVVVKLAGDSTRRQLDFGLPPALSSRLTLALHEPDAAVEFPGAISFTRAAQGKTTVVEAVLGASDRLALSWTPRSKRASEMAATVFAEQTSLVTFGGGVVHTKSVFDFRVSQGELRQLRVALPEGQHLLNVGGDEVRSWDFAGTNRAVIVVDLLKAVSPTARLVVETERYIAALPADVQVRLPRALEVKRESGLVGVSRGQELGLGALRAAGLERADDAEFARKFGDEKLSLIGAWRFLRSDFDLAVRAETLKPKIEAIARDNFTVGNDHVDIATSVDYTVTRSGVFVLRLAIPRETRVETVLCDAMRTWTESDDGTNRVLEIPLKKPALGPISVALRLARTFTNLPPVIELAGAHPLDPEKLTGYVSVSAEPGVGLKTSVVAGLADIPSASLPGGAERGATTLAFKYLATGAGAAAPWRLSLATELLESWVRAEIASFVSVSETLASGRATARFEIQNAPVKEFRLKTPAAWRNVEITGAGVRRRDETTNGDSREWRVELQGKVQGDYRLSVRWEEPRFGGTNFAFHGVEALGVERETGTLGFYPQGQLQLAQRDAGDPLLRIDARELPDWATDRPAGAPALSYRYLRPGWNIALDARHFEDAALLQLLVDGARLQTVVADDGQFMTRITLTARNNGRQSLGLTLPAGSTVWAAFVDGQPVRPSQENGRLLLPLERTAADDAPIQVELTYVGSGKFPRTGGGVELVSPRLDAPLKDARWEVFLPPDHTYAKFGGSMTYESADLVSVAQEFTLAQYQRQEYAERAYAEARASNFLKQTRKDLSGGKVASFGKLSQFQSAAGRDETSAREFKSLQEDLGNAQAGNLVQAQADYAYYNNAILSRDGTAEADAAKNPLNYNAQAAGEQVAQLQKAQAVAVKRVTPLRVNLPTRGLRHTFVQALQTEVDKPLTIQFNAVNDRETSWLKNAILWAGGFLAIWLALAIATAFRPARATGAGAAA